MKKLFFGLVVAPVVAFSASDRTEWVDTLIGGSYRGHTFPGAACPFGLVQPSPDTGLPDWDHCSGYVWEDPYVYGFTQTHLSGTGCYDLADVRLLPFSCEFADSNPMHWRQAKDPATEIGRPGYYSVAFSNDLIRAEVTASPRVAVYRFTYANGRPAKLLVDGQWNNTGNMKCAVKAFEQKLGADSRTIVGSRMVEAWLTHRIAWKIELSRPWKSVRELPRQDGERGSRCVLEFEPGAVLQVKVAISSVDEEGATRNLVSDVGGQDFDAIREEARERWNRLLQRLDVAGVTDEQRIAIYTALYHLFLQPNDIADADGRYRGGDGRVAKSPDGHYYTGLSLWDTFRAAHPFYTLSVPERVDGFVNSMLSHYKALGYLPVIPYFGWESFCMIGNHAVPVVVDAYLKGFRGFDTALAFEAVTNSLSVAHVDPLGRKKIKEEWDVLERYGYYPFDLIRGESVSRTLECSYDDACAARFAKALGEVETESRFSRRAANWRHLIDPQAGFARGKDSSGKWREPFDPFSTGHDQRKANDYTEGNAFQYTWHVLQDPCGLFDALGGREKAYAKLDALFKAPELLKDAPPDVSGLIGQYAHGNEPSHHVAYLFTLAGRPDRTAEVVREVCDRFYGVKPGDLCGNDDCGQMSAWYLFAVMGFYPVDPCGGDYVLGAPQVPEATLNLADGRQFIMRAKNLSRKNKYVKSVTLNGKAMTGSVIRHADIVSGGTLAFEMTDRVELR